MNILRNFHLPFSISTGKVVLQYLDIVNEVFSPTPVEIERAQAVMAAHQSALEKGRGAVSVDGRLVDQATIRMARQLCEQARRLGLL